MPEAFDLPTGMVVLERGWLSSNNIVFSGSTGTAVVDTGYVSHCTQTLALIREALGGAPLDVILNTHLHSDHCGGNALLQQSFPGCETRIPPGQSRAVLDWDEEALTFAPTGQNCPRFRFEGVLRPGEFVMLGEARWEIHAAPGHDPHSVILFEPASRVLISADALWANGFGVVFPELEGEQGFADVGRTLDVIEDLSPRVVVPGHGALFSDVDQALGTARSRLDNFMRNPARHAVHAAKVLLKFKLLEQQRIEVPVFLKWAMQTRYFQMLHARHFMETDMVQWLQQLLTDLEHSGVLRHEDHWLINT